MSRTGVRPVPEELDKDGVSVEVVDVPTLVPLDIETIVASVRKTSRAVESFERPPRFIPGAGALPPIKGSRALGTPPYGLERQPSPSGAPPCPPLLR